ncbi:MAG: M23 family metallopeptidase [Bacteroidales bacterium]|nr:M23 family metallopeptidase [Bacteroidales bacterium]
MKRFFRYWYSRFFSNIHYKYRLVIMNEGFEEKLWFRLSRLNVFVIVGMTVIGLIVGTLFLIAFTNLREFIPGYTKTEVAQLAYQNQSKIDSLENLLNAHEKLLFAMNLAISGEIHLEEIQDIRDSAFIVNYADITNERSKEDDQLREQFEKSERFNLAQQPRPAHIGNIGNIGESANSGTSFTTQSLSPMLFFVPLEGTILEDFNAQNRHFGIDITGKMNDVIKAVQSGTVVSSDWTTDANYVITIQHENNMLSIYKHNSALLKSVGDFVRSGEPIAFIGNSGEGYKGPILHFELWFQGSPVNPRDYVPF